MTFEFPLDSSVFNLINFKELSIMETDLVLQMRNHPDIRRWMINDKTITKIEHIKFINSLSDKEFHFMVRDNKDEYIGIINFKNIILNDSADFGIYANPFSIAKYKGKNLLNLGIIFAKRILKLNCISLFVFKHNTRAIELYLRNGFVSTDRRTSLGEEFEEYKLML